MWLTNSLRWRSGPVAFADSGDQAVNLPDGNSSFNAHLNTGMSYDPTTSLLIDDFDTFLRYAANKNPLPLTGTGDLKAADLWALNDRVNYKASLHVTPRSRQADYPLLGFLFQIATSSRLLLVTFGKTNALVPDASRVEQYHGLTLEEKYVFLLETAWCYVDWGTLDNDGRSGEGATWFWSAGNQLLKNPVGTPVTLFERGWAQEDNPAMIHLSGMANAYIRAGHWFGWYDVREVKQEKRDRFALQLDQVTLNHWGKQCLTLLMHQRPFAIWNQHADRYFFLSDDEQPNQPINLNTFANTFQKEFNEPDLVSLYPINPNPQTGEIWLRVELPQHKVSRTIALPVSGTLDDLHHQIQGAFGFDNDHLYGFYLNLRDPYQGKQYFDPRTSPGWADGYPSDATTIASLNLYEGQRLLYVFDFGDNWQFLVTVFRHLPNEKNAKARVVEKVGKAPKQYN